MQNAGIRESVISNQESIIAKKWGGQNAEREYQIHHSSFFILPLLPLSIPSMRGKEKAEG